MVRSGKSDALSELSGRNSGYAHKMQKPVRKGWPYVIWMSVGLIGGVVLLGYLYDWGNDYFKSNWFFFSWIGIALAIGAFIDWRERRARVRLDAQQVRRPAPGE